MKIVILSSATALYCTVRRSNHFIHEVCLMDFSNISSWVQPISSWCHDFSPSRKLLSVTTQTSHSRKINRHEKNGRDSDIVSVFVPVIIPPAISIEINASSLEAWWVVSIIIYRKKVIELFVTVGWERSHSTTLTCQYQIVEIPDISSKPDFMGSRSQQKRILWWSAPRLLDVRSFRCNLE